MKAARMVTLGCLQNQEVCSGGPGSPPYRSSMSSSPRPNKAPTSQCMEICATACKKTGERIDWGCPHTVSSGLHPHMPSRRPQLRKNPSPHPSPAPGKCAGIDSQCLHLPKQRLRCPAHEDVCLSMLSDHGHQCAGELPALCLILGMQEFLGPPGIPGSRGITGL